MLCLGDPPVVSDVLGSDELCRGPDVFLLP